MASVLTKKGQTQPTIDLQIQHPNDAPINVISKPVNKQIKLDGRCPKCHQALHKALSMSGSESTFWMECTNCGALVNTYRPLPHQAEFLSTSARYKMTAGGYGTGKTTTDIEDVIKHLMIIPMARVCIAARTYPALESTFVKDFFATFPDKLIVKRNDQKHEYKLSNGSEFMFRSFDDPTKLKSLNLTMVVIVEASDVPYEGFTMMQTRIRNTKAMIPFYNQDGTPVTYIDAKTGDTKIKYRVDARHINLETNPASNWVKSNFLCDAAVVRYLGSAKNENYRMNKNPDTNKYVQVVSTDANPHLPETYIDELSHGKSQAWISQFIKGSFNFNDNLVFPNIGLCITPNKPLPREFDEHGNRVLYYMIGFDYGIVDYSHAVFCALDTIHHKLIVYDEMRINNSDVRDICREYRKVIKTNGTNLKGLLMLPLFDGRSYNKRESDLHTIGGAFEAQGLYFEPSFTKHDVRIVKMNSLINHNQIEIFSTCEYLIEELLNYTYVLDKEGRSTGKPKDGKDHGITALEFVIAELPHNLAEINIRGFLPDGTLIEHDKSINSDIKSIEPIFDPLARKEDTYGSFNNNRNYFSNNINDNNLSFSIGIIQDYDDNEEESQGSLRAYINS